MIGNMISQICRRFSNTNVKQFSTSIVRYASLPSERYVQSRKIFHYTTAIVVSALGLTYAAVPLYRIFCQTTSYAGTVAGHTGEGVDLMKPVRDRIIRVTFNADTAAQMIWKFQPQQKELKLVPGETALIFYTATNPTDEPVTGISTYNVVPFEAGQYFNKIQCFCFEEQQLNPHEQVDMPVFFYIDPEFANDPAMEYCNEITLSYTFFEAKKNFRIPKPSFLKEEQAQLQLQ